MAYFPAYLLIILFPQFLLGDSKHPEAADIADENLLYGPIDYIPPGVFDPIDKKMIFDAASNTMGSAGPSGMDVELYRRILHRVRSWWQARILRRS